MLQVSLTEPKLAKIIAIKDETPDVKTFTLQFNSKPGGLNFKPGQFVQLSVFGYGEAPFSMSSSPYQTESFEVSVKKIGRLTNRLHQMNVGDVVGIRGPLGNGFPLESLEKTGILIVGGGIGIAPLKSLIETLLHKNPERKEKITLLYGARTPSDLVFKKELKNWSRKITVHLTVDRATDRWNGKIGPVTVLFDVAKINPKRSNAVICGPPVMMYFTVKKCLEKGFKPKNLYLSLERQMVCGIGKCWHCNIGPYRVCLNGPIFCYDALRDFPELFE